MFRLFQSIRRVHPGFTKSQALQTRGFYCPNGRSTDAKVLQIQHILVNRRLATNTETSAKNQKYPHAAPKANLKTTTRTPSGSIASQLPPSGA
jgi:hypothetical protein